MIAASVLAAGFGTGQVLWSVVWILALVVLPFFGGLFYLGLHGADMSRRMGRGGRRRRTEPVGGSAEHERFRLTALHDARAIDDEEYEAARARIGP